VLDFNDMLVGWLVGWLRGKTEKGPIDLVISYGLLLEHSIE
jgi:hypothetical protein